MKKLFLLFVFVIFATCVQSQTSVVFHENFELPSLGDSLISTSDPAGANPWAITTHLKNSGLRADSTIVQPSATTYLTTNSFSTTGFSKVFLKFSQICKLYITDGGSVQYSVDGGNNWLLINATYYRGNGVMALDKFSENSYSTWVAGDTTTLPTNNWWKNETFDLSDLIANQSNVKIRFRITDGGFVGGQGRYGWLLDDVQVIAANNELTAPTITFKAPVLADTIYVTGPLQINAWVKDSSGLGSVNLSYSMNGGTNIVVPMTNVIDSLYTATLPSSPYNTTFCYSITANDIYNNSSTLPSSCQLFLLKKGTPTVQVGNGSLTGFNSPIYINSATTTSLYSYYVALMTKDEIKSGGTIESIAFNKTDAFGYNLSNATMRIYIKSTSSVVVPNIYTDYNAQKAGATKIYESTTQNINLSAGWQTFTCNTGNLHSYAGNENLMVFVEFYHPGNATGAPTWQYTTAAGMASTFYGTTSVPSSSITTGQRANMKINFESSTSAIDAKVASIISPSSVIVANTSVPISLKIKNLGTTTLTSAKVHWSVDGVYQSFANWNGSLDQDFISGTISLGNFNFTLGVHTLKAWTDLPNGIADQNPANDTLTFSLYSCQNLSGLFTVGNSTSDFPTFNDVFTALGNCGVMGPVTFKIKSGTYNQQLTIPYINNTSSVNTVTFESESGNQADVNFIYSATGTGDNFVLKYDASQFVKVKNITFKATGATYAYVAVLANGASNNTLEGCKLEMNGTTSSMAGIYNASTFNENYNTFKNNTILNGYYGVYIYGASANKEKGNVFEGNNITGFNYYGMSLYYQDSITVTKNIVANPSGTTSYGIYAYYNDNGIYLKNKINMTAATTNYCFYLYYNNTGGTGNSLVANNFISQSVGTSTVYGLYSNYSKNMKIFNNSVNVTKGTTSGYAFYVGYGSGINLYNNISSNTGGGYAFYAPTITPGIDSSNNNNFYATGINLGYWGSAKTNLAALQLASGKDQNSLNLNPMYVSVSDLHTSNFLLGSRGKSLTEVNDDIDGDIRATIPCIGADEFAVPQNEAGIVQINQPLSMITTANQDIKVSIQSLGQLPLTAVTVKWSVNGVLQTPYSYTGNIPQFGIDSVVIGNFIFGTGYSQIKVWTEMPNNAQDIYNVNDTMYKSVFSCSAPMSGTYTVGGVAADFPSVEAAISSLQCGVSGPVVFDINPGIYSGNYLIQAITGASATNTITFKSTSNDSTSVVLQYNASGTADNYLFNFNNSGNIILKGLTLKALNTTNANIITLTGTLANISIQNSILEGTQSGNTDDNQVLIRCVTLNQIDGFNLISNKLNYGRMAINFLSTVASTNVVFKYNYMYNQSARPMNLNRIAALDFGYNELFSDATKTGNGGIFTTNLTGQWKFYNNKLINLGGIRVWEGWVNSGTGAGQEALVYNNYLYGNPASSYVFDGGGTYTYVKFLHNTFVGNPTATVVNFNNYYGCNNFITFKNNILYSTGSKLLHTTPSATSGSPICSSNFQNYTFNNNNYYTTGATLATFNGTTCANLAALKTATTQETNSVSLNPQFVGTTDPHITNYSLKGLASAVPEVTDDIDGQLRSTIAPDPGCDELMMYNNDAGIVSLLQGAICPGNTPIVVKLKNFGTNPINNVDINWSVNGITQNPFLYSGSLASLADTNLNIGNYNFLSLINYNLLVWTSLPNNLADGYSANDTLKILNTFAGLSAGSYSVGDSTSDFLNLTTAINFISTNGVCGPVVFNIKPGTYTGRYTIPAILGTSAVNTVTIKSLNDDSTSVVLAATATGTADNWIVKLNGCQYVTVKNLKFTPLNATYANAIVIANTSKFNKIQGNYLVSANTSGSGADLSLIRSEDVNSTDNFITANRTLGGSMGIYIKGVSTTSRLERVYVAKNLIENFMQYGIRCEYANSPVIDSNTVISYLANTGTRIGVSMYYGYDSTKVTKNTIILSNCTNTQGVGYEYMTGTATAKSLIANNFVSLLNGVTGTYAIRMYPNNYYAIVANNSIFINGTSNTDTRGINSATQNTNVEVYNNNVVSNKYPCFYEGTSVIKSDNNNYYSTTNLYGYYVTAYVNFTTMAALATATQKDSNTVSIDPIFYSNTDLHSDNVGLYAKGKSLPNVTIDIDGQSRAAIPCIGADEFVITPNDVKVKALYTYGNLSKQNAVPHIVKAIIKNVGSNPQTNINVTLNITGSSTFTNTKTIASLATGAEDTISFDPFTPLVDGINLVKVSLPSDDIISNNELIYNQNVTDSIFGYAENLNPTGSYGFNTGSGLILNKYYLNGSKLIKSIRAYITKNNTIGNNIYGVVLNQNGVIVDSTLVKTITATDTNTWVTLDLISPPNTSTINNYFYVGIAQKANTSVGYYPVGTQTENPGRRNAYFYSNTLAGTTLVETTTNGRFMIDAVTMLPANYDASVAQIVTPNSGCGNTNAETVKIKIANNGLNPIYGTTHGLVANYALRVNGNLINIVTQAVSDTIQTATLKDFTFTTPVDIYASTTDSNYSLVSWVNLNNDPFHNNDTLTKAVLSKYTPPAPLVNSISIPYATQGTLNAVSSDTIFWYHQAIGGTKIAQGPSYTTPVLYTSDTLWANAVTKFSANAILGTGTTTNGATASYPAPYGNYWWGAKYQILITKAELNAFGAFGGLIKSLAFDVAVVGGAPLQNFQIKMGHTTNTALATGSYLTNLTTVYTNPLFTDVVGWNTHVFTSPFVWNGIDNIIVETCFNNSAYTTNAQTRYTATPFNSVVYSYGDNANNCTNATSTAVTSNRPNMKLSIEKDGCESNRTQAIVTVAPPPANEAGLLAFTNPTGPVPSNTLTDIKVLLKNYGTQPLSSVKVDYKLNSVLQPQYLWNDLANPVLPGGTKELTIGSFTLPGGLDTLIAWTSEPNGLIDINPLNDTAKVYFSSCMSGTFTIGIGKNFPSFTTALNSLNGAGICGNVVFLVDSGLYEERLFINPINGAGPNSTITFTSATGDSTDVVLHYTLSSAAAWAMKFIGSSYFTFSKMTLSVSGSNTWGRIMELGPNSHHIEISNCVIEGLQAGSSSSNYALIFASGAAINYNTYKNNLMLNGSHGIYLYGVSGNLNKSNTVIGNTFKDFFYYGIYVYYQDSITVSSNTVQNLASAATVYGLYSLYANNNIYTKNKIQITGTSAYCMYLSSNNTPSGNGLVANNFVSQSVGTSVVYGLYLTSSNNLNVYNNSVNVTGGSSTYYAFYISAGSNNNIVNNIFSNSGGGYAYYASSSTGINTSNYNNLYATGTNLAYWGAAKTNLAALQAASGKDLNSISVNPGFFGVHNLHMINFLIDKTGTPLAQVTDDIDGDPRNATLPDIGADEFDLPDNDAGILAMTTPTNPAVTGVQNVNVIMKNWGVLNLSSVAINWSVNGVLQSPFNWLGNKASGEVDTVWIGVYNFPTGQSAMKFWTSMPNNVVDQLNMNDTLTTSVIACSGPLSGNYTIGGSSADYATFTGAVQSLQMCGVGGPVIFNVNPGNYNEQFLISTISGVSATNSVTFQSATGDSTSVILGYNFTQSGKNYVIQLTGAQYITIKGITIRQTNPSSGRVINFTGSPSNITIANNRIEMPFNTAGTTAGVVTLSSDFGNDNKILNNNISTGYNGIVAQGSAAAPALRTLIKGNIITGFYNFGIQCTYLNSPVIDSNVVISNVSGSGTRNGILLNNCTDSLKITRNSIVMSNSANTNGISFETVTSTANAKGLIANNFVSLLNGTSFTYGIRMYPINYIVIANNSIFVNGSSATDTRGINVVNGTNNEVYNNNVVCNRYPNFYENNSVLKSDFNNFYSTTNTYGYFNGSTVNFTSLSALSAAYQKDSNSVSSDPDFISNTNLHVYTSAVNNLGLPLSNITTDIDGQLRDANTPDIGADEFSPLPIDLGVTTIYEPSVNYSQAGTNIVIKVRFKNFGADSISNFNVVCKYGNNAPIVQPYSAYLLSNKSDSIFFNVTVLPGNNEINTYTSLVSDGNHTNDTTKINFFGVPLKNIPYSDNFDGATEEWFKTGGGLQWQRGIPNATVINTAHTAPNVWTTVLNGNYINNSDDYLYTPIFNNSILKADTLKFWFKIDAENNKDGGYIEYKDYNGQWLRLGSISTLDTNSVNWYNSTTTAMWTGTGLGWQQAKYAVSKMTNLPQYIQFRFVFYSDGVNNNFNGWAIDDFELTLLPIPDDAGVIAITNPNTSLMGDTVYPTITVKNFGLNPLTSIPVKYSINNQTPVSEIFNTTLAPGATADYTFNTYFKVLTQPTYTIKAYTTVTGDYYTGADTTTKVVNVSPALNDVGVTGIISPTDIVSSGSVITVKVKIKNFGTNPLTSIPVSFQRGTQPAINEVWTGPALNLGDTAIFSFNTTFTVPLGSSFAFSAFTTLANDAYIPNNKITKSITISTTIPGNAGNISSTEPVFGGDTICFPIAATTPKVVTYTVPTIGNVSNYVWNYTGTNVTFTTNDTTTSNSVTISFEPNATSGLLTVYGFNTIGNGNTSPAFSIDIIQNCTIGIDEDLLDNFWMSQNMPNPTNSNTVIEYNIPKQGDISFEIVNMIGQSIYKFKETKEPGRHSINLNISDMPDGIYYYTLIYKGNRLVKKMIVNK